VLGALDARDAGVQPSLVLERVEVAPHALLGVVVDRMLLAALRARELRARCMPDVDVHPSLDELEVHLRHLPGRGEPEELLEYFDVLHLPSEPPLRRLVKLYPRDSRKGRPCARLTADGIPNS